MKNLAEHHRQESVSLPEPVLFFNEGIRKNSSNIQPQPQFQQTISHKGKIPLTTEYNHLEGFYLNAQIAKELGEVHSVSFEEKSDLRVGRDNSRQQVFFGDITFETENTSLKLPVAVKPFRSQEFNHATHEAGMNAYAKSVGLPTFDIIGSYHEHVESEEPRSFLVSRFEPDVTTLDNLNWQDMSEEQRWQNLSPAIESLAAIHARAIFHGDSELKNLATSDGRGIKIVDLEHASSLKEALDASIPNAFNRLRMAMSVDFTHLARSLDEFFFAPSVIGKQLTDKEKFVQIEQFVFEPYKQLLLKRSEHQQLFELVYTAMVDKKREML